MPGALMVWQRYTPSVVVLRGGGHPLMMVYGTVHTCVPDFVVSGNLMAIFKTHGASGAREYLNHRSWQRPRSPGLDEDFRKGGHRFSTRANGQARGLTPGREPGRPQGRERKNVLAGIIIPNDDRTLSPITNVSTATVRAGGADLGTCTNTWDHAIGLRGGGLPGILSSLSKRKEMWLEAAEFVLAWLDLATPALQHMWNVFRALFGLSLLFYGTEFATLAFHVIVFRLSGWKKAARYKDELVTYYKDARQAMRRAAADIRVAADTSRRKKLKDLKTELMEEQQRLLANGDVTKEEAKAFIDSRRKDIETIAREEEIAASASNSVLAIKNAVSFEKLSMSINNLYAAVVVSITASTFKRAGQITLALTCGSLIKRVLFDLLGPIIDPIGYQLELETYVTKIMRGRANSYMSAVGFLASAALFFHFVVEPQEALMVTFVLLGARIVTDTVINALNPLRRKLGFRKMNDMPISAVIYVACCALGFTLQGEAGVIGEYVCRPYIGLLGGLNRLLNRFQISTIDYFS